MPQRKRIVIAGAGFAGVHVAKQLEDDCDVTLVAPTDRFVYLPLVHEVVSDHVRPAEVTRRLADVLPATRLVHGRAQRVEERELVTAAGARFPFDALVVAIGAQPHDYGVKGVHEHALTFASLGDALRANGALKAQAADARPEALRVVVAGAGFTGVEVAGEAAELLDALETPRDILVLDALPEIFPRQGKEFRQRVEAAMREKGIRLETGRKIVEVRADGLVIQVGGGEAFVPSDVTFWCAGIKPRTLEGVDARVRPTLQSAARDDVFVLGDAAMFPREMGVPQLAQTAEDEADVCAWNVLYPERMRKYEPHVRGVIVSIGHHMAVAELRGGVTLAGNIPWHVKRRLYKAKIAMI